MAAALSPVLAQEVSQGGQPIVPGGAVMGVQNRVIQGGCGSAGGAYGTCITDLGVLTTDGSNQGLGVVDNPITQPYHRLYLTFDASGNGILGLEALGGASPTNLLCDINGVISACLGGGGGGVTSVSLSLPSIFIVSGSPVTNSGTLTGTLAAENANYVFAGPVSGSATTPTFRPLVAADLPVCTGSAPGAVPGGGSITTYLRGDCTWQPVSGGGGSGTVTSVGLSMPSIFSVTGSPVTTSGTLTASLVAEPAGTFFAGPASGPNAIPTFRALTAADLPLCTGSTPGDVPGGGSITTFLRGDCTWQPVPSATGSACTAFHLLSSATTNATSVKGSAGNLCEVVVMNTTSAIYDLRFYDTASTPTCTSATGVVWNVPVPNNQGNGGGYVISIPTGLSFTNGIGFCLTGAVADNDGTNAATGVAINGSYL